MSPQPFENRLIKEKSPYLLKHASNPVDWYPWGEEAFERAQLEDKPIFLSIGYATCHWCHVMSRESFDHVSIGALMNEVFVNIKVDREELPEIDNLYMEFAQALMESGTGWPLNVILTPDLKPFYAITYMPPKTRQDKLGLYQLAQHIQQLWKSEERELLFDQAEKLVALFERSVLTKGTELPSEALIMEALEILFEGVDPIYGGLKGAPKFPLGYQCLLYLECASYLDDSRSLFFAEVTLDRISRGGIHDHLGGGFSRYTIDEKWQIPHFEKMLYDNALLGEAYLQAWKLTKKEKYRKIAEGIIDYVLRDMQHSEGGFYSAQDADVNGVEGSYYLWSREEVEALLPVEMSSLFCEFFDITQTGNFEKKNILHRPYTLEEFVDFKGLSIDGLEKDFFKCLKRLFEEREKRSKPFKDDKILLSWNALMIHTCIKAGMAFQQQSYIQAGVRAAIFLHAHLWKEGKLYRRFREGHSDFEGSLDDYASMIRALITLYEAGMGEEWLDWAVEMTELLEKQFKAEEGAFYFTGPENTILLRRCEIHDSSVPSGNALHAENLLRLYQITHNNKYWIQAEDILKVTKSYIEAYPQGAFYHLRNLIYYFDKEKPTFIIALDEQGSLKKEINYLIHTHFLPGASVVWAEDSEYIPIEGKTTLYICIEGKCKAPLQLFEEIEKAFLDEKWKT